MAKILIVEDEAHMRIGLRDNLEFEGYQVSLASDGKEGLEMLLQNHYDLALLDVMMPRMSGFDVCKEARKQGIATPVIFLTAKGEEIDKVLGLELGADDYVTKPFSLRELLARVKAVLRRGGYNEDQEGAKVKIGRLVVDFQHYEAHLDGEPEKLSHKEFEILQYLLKHKNEAVSRYKLLEDVWGYDAQPTTRTVDNFMLKLRQRIEYSPNDPHIILTVHGIGYKLVMSGGAGNG